MSEPLRRGSEAWWGKVRELIAELAMVDLSSYDLGESVPEWVDTIRDETLGRELGELGIAYPKLETEGDRELCRRFMAEIRAERQEIRRRRVEGTEKTEEREGG